MKFLNKYWWGRVCFLLFSVSLVYALMQMDKKKITPPGMVFPARAAAGEKASIKNIQWVDIDLINGPLIHMDEQGEFSSNADPYRPRKTDGRLTLTGLTFKLKPQDVADLLDPIDVETLPDGGTRYARFEDIPFEAVTSVWVVNSAGDIVDYYRTVSSGALGVMLVFVLFPVIYLTGVVIRAAYRGIKRIKKA